MEFPEPILKALESSIIKSINDGKAIDIPYGSRIDVSDIARQAYAKINYSKLEAKITDRLEEVIAEKIVNKIVTEMGNDIKQLMQNATIRDDFRFMLRTGVNRILESVKG